MSRLAGSGTLYKKLNIRLDAATLEWLREHAKPWAGHGEKDAGGYARIVREALSLYRQQVEQGKQNA